MNGETRAGGVCARHGFSWPQPHLAVARGGGVKSIRREEKREESEANRPILRNWHIYPRTNLRKNSTSDRLEIDK